MTDVAEREEAGAAQGPIRACANVCEAAGCMSLEAERVLDALSERVTERGLTDVAVKRVGCLRLCAAGPLVEIPELGQLFEAVDPTSPESIDRVVDALAGEGGAGHSTADDPFFARQVRIVLANEVSSTPRTSTTTWHTAVTRLSPRPLRRCGRTRS